MSGTFTSAARIASVFRAYSLAAVTANQYLSEEPVLANCRLGAVKVRAETAGTGAGNTVVSLLLNGVSVWTSAGNRPTLAAVSTGEFASKAPNQRSLQHGDVLSWQVASISATGHARLSCAVSLEVP